MLHATASVGSPCEDITSCPLSNTVSDDTDISTPLSVDISTESTEAECTPGTSLAAFDNSSLAACPVCQVHYSPDFLHIHASSCGDSLDETSAALECVTKTTGSEINNVSDVIQTIADAVCTDGPTFDITISRQNLLQRGLIQWQRQKKIITS